MRPHLLVVQNAEFEDLGHFATAFEALGLSWRTVHAWDGERVPSSLGDQLGLVLLGGPQAVHLPEQWPSLEREMALVREAYAIRAPVLGVCLGAQLVAQALGGRARPGDGSEMGFAPVALAPEGRSDPVTAELAGGPPLLHLHHDTYDLPPGAVRLASSERYMEQAFRVGDRVYGLQFHVEMTPAVLERILPAEVDDLREAGVDVAALLAQARMLETSMAKAARAVAAGFAGCGCFL